MNFYFVILLLQYDILSKEERLFINAIGDLNSDRMWVIMMAVLFTSISS